MSVMTHHTVAAGRLLALAGVLAAGPLAAQGMDSLVLGQRIRLTRRAALADAWVGNLVGLVNGRLVVRRDSTLTDTLAVGEIRRLELSRGMVTGARTGSRIGAGAGVVAGLVAGFVTRPRGRPCRSSSSFWGLPSLDLSCVGTIAKDVGWVALLGIGGGGAGAGLGALIGLPFHAERWEQVPLERLRLQVAPQAGGLSVSLGFAF